jgi:DNA-binding NtrC family response regulator
MNAKILIVDDEPAICSGCKMILAERGYSVEVASSGRQGLEKLRNATFDLVLLDIKLPEISGLEILTRIKQEMADVYVIMMTGHGTVANAVEAMKKGAFDFITKPFAEEQLIQTVAKAVENIALVTENRNLRKQLHDKFNFNNIIGSTPPMLAVFEKIERVAPMDSIVLLDGESGTGKELFANAIHVRSKRAAHRFLAVDCSTFSASLLESELFGHVKGAFTGADSQKQGIFEAASAGTLFLDEVANLDLDIQGKLLRVLETGEYKPVGSSQVKKTMARVIVATNRDLSKMVDNNQFRPDLFYRLNVFPIYIPPLRDRRDDIPKIAYHFLKLFCRKAGKKISGFSDDALKTLVHFDWPGNVRQLKNVVERLVIMCDGNQLDHGVLMDNFETRPTGLSETIPGSLEELKSAKKRFLEDHFSRVEKIFLQNALAAAGGNITKAAQKVGMQRSNFSALMKKHALAPSKS